jgi:hypothetical protein
MKQIKEPFMRRNQNKNLTINNTKGPLLPNKHSKRLTPQQTKQIEDHRIFMESYLTQIMTLDLISEIDDLKEFFGLFRIQKRELIESDEIIRKKNNDNDHENDGDDGDDGDDGGDGNCDENERNGNENELLKSYFLGDDNDNDDDDVRPCR